MWNKCVWLLFLMTRATVDAGSPQIPEDSLILRSLDERLPNGVDAPRSQWIQRPLEDFRQHRPGGASHGLGSHTRESTLGATETSSEHPGHSSFSQEYWRLGASTVNFTGADHHGPWAAHFGSATAPHGPSRQDSHQEWRGTHSPHRYYQMRPGAVGPVKKATAFYAKGNLPYRGFDASGKPKYKVTALRQYPAAHRPATIRPPQGNFYRSPLQWYAVPSREAPRRGLEASTASPSLASVAQRHHTTERMDDAHPEAPFASEDYSAYDDARYGSGGNYYETYEEAERTTSESEDGSRDENTTRGYYGDRIYMSAQVPLVSSSDRAALKNKYFIVRRTSGDEDIETIFE